jgi:phospholipid/cholesterol/gamma-HCH transport system ATP-binding protein
MPANHSATDAIAIDVHALTTHYGKRKILDAIDFQVEQREIRVIMGGSGSGKSTLLRHLLGLRHQRPGAKGVA